MLIIISGPIFTQRKKPKAVWDQDINTLQRGREIMWHFFRYMELETFSYYFVFTKTLNMCIGKYKLVYLDQFQQEKPKALWEINNHDIKYGRENLWYLFIYIDI